MDLKQIKQIIELMKRAELSEFAVEDEGFKLKIRRGGNGSATQGRNSNPPFVVASSPSQNPGAAPVAPATTPAPVTSTSEVAGGNTEEAGVIYIKSCLHHRGDEDHERNPIRSERHRPRNFGRKW